MIRNLLLSLCLLFPVMTSAQVETQFTFSGQNAEVLKGEKKVTQVTQVPVEFPSTCTRQIPHEVRVCRDVTRYRQSCSTIPSSERCWNESDRVCRPVIRTRQECSSGPSRRVCQQQPTRRICTERPARQICQTRPDGRRVCTDVRPGEHCTEVGGGMACHDVPGERVCRSVTYTDQECDSVTRRRCETVPSRRECTDIPYSENVCGMETQYSSESYACTQTRMENRTSEKTIRSEVNVQILTNGLVEEFPMSVVVKETTPAMTAFAMEAKLLKEPQAFVVLKKKEVKIASATEKEIVLKGSLVLEVLEARMLPISFPTAIESAHIEAASQKLIVVMEGGVSSQGSVDLQITHNSLLTKLKTIAEAKAEYPSAKAELGQVENKAALSVDLKGLIQNEPQKKNMRMNIKLGSKLMLQGEIMNAKKPDTEKQYEGIFVELK
ncbi:hypothetical protein [Peredibacter starrii]|uniref:Uncharacterized protein n=1 Tax=Peredibacter starrii TaxID=28202 RepID=A0AAX4HT06_9BACT|nr:hypothetical protein [Peredibacter starrii]WPU66434.1 hypothetical protein SOO65_06715 [Peredibacter starrii]